MIDEGLFPWGLTAATGTHINARLPRTNASATVEINGFRWQTWVWHRVEWWVDSESNAFRLSHDLIWIKKGEVLWVMSQSEAIPRSSTWVMSWFWVNSWKDAWVMSWIDSSFRDTAWVMSWFESRHLSRMPQEGQRNLAKAQKRSTKMSESLKKVDEINRWFESLSHDLTRINIPDCF